eukprot:SAG11_NODE_5391_length_1574_cov_1.206102_2_plen_27_part_01
MVSFFVRIATLTIDFKWTLEHPYKQRK